MFELAMPWVLLLVIVPWIIRHYSAPVVSQLSQALKVPFFQSLMNDINHDRPLLGRLVADTLYFMIWLLMVIAAAGPRWVGEPVPQARDGRNIMMALDLSGSMEMDDMVLNGQSATRLDIVKHAAKQFVSARFGDHIGLIVFGAQAYVQTPLTFDRQNVLQRIDDATAGLAGKTTSIGDALGLAVKRLQSVPQKSRVIILLTDGVNNSGILAPLKAAELARDNKIKVYTIGLGTADDASRFNGLPFTINSSSDLDEKTLQDIADMTGGRYFRATNPKALQDIYYQINQLEPVSQDLVTLRPQKEYYPWPLAAALLLFLISLPPSGALLRRLLPVGKISL